MQRFQETEHVFVPADIKTTSTENLKNFITKYFQIPDNDLERICWFIRTDCELEKIIYDLPSLIQKEIPYKLLQMKFYNEFQEEFLRLEIHIMTLVDFTVSLEIEYQLEQKLYELYNSNSVDKILLMME